MSEHISLQQVTLRFEALTVLENIDLSLTKGEFVVLLGPSMLQIMRVVMPAAGAP